MLVISGPSGAGKSTIVEYILDTVPGSCRSVSTTSRPRRRGEVDGREYHFMSVPEFEEAIRNGEFLEYETVHSNYYGTSVRRVEQSLLLNRLLLFDVDVNGHDSIKKRYPNAKSIFLTVRSIDVLKERLMSRGLDDFDVVETRVRNAKRELRAAVHFDYLVVNDNLDDTKLAVKSIVDSMEFLNCGDRLLCIMNDFCVGGDYGKL